MRLNIATYCALWVWLIRYHAMPLAIRCFSPNLYLEKQGMSLRVAGILSMCFSSHTQLTWNQKLLLVRSYLCASVCHVTLISLSLVLNPLFNNLICWQSFVSTVSTKSLMSFIKISGSSSKQFRINAITREDKIFYVLFVPVVSIGMNVLWVKSNLLDFFINYSIQCELITDLISFSR